MMMKFFLEIVVVLSSSSFQLEVEVLAPEKTMLSSPKSLSAVLVLVVLVVDLMILSLFPDSFHQEKETVLLRMIKMIVVVVASF